MRLVIRLGDTSTHGGQVVTACSKFYAEGKLVARKGDIFDCPKKGHGRNPIAVGSPNTITEGMPTARHGDQTNCGAALISGAVKTYVN